MQFTRTEDGKYVKEDGTVVSRAEVIRELFQADWKRADIAKELEVPYNVVFQATANMKNAHHAPGQSVTTQAVVELEDGTKMSRREYIRMRIKEGATRGEVAKELGVSYSAVWNATKDMPEAGGSGAGGRKFVEVNGEQIPRTEYIRQQFAAGKTRREIANELGVDYNVVWQATKPAKENNNEGNDNSAQSEASAAKDEVAVAEDKNGKGKGKGKNKPEPGDDGGNDPNFPS